MILNDVAIDDTFAEAFDMSATRLVITAIDHIWARHAAEAMTGFATSVIGCGAEAGIERVLPAEATPDGRPGISVLLFAPSGKVLAKQVETRVGQCVLTAPTTAIYAGIDGEPIPLGKHLRFFGDGFQSSKKLGERRYWRVPVMDGEFLCEEHTGRVKSVGGGNFFVMAESVTQALRGCEAAVSAMRALPNVVLPFPGGVVRSGSKVGAKYSGLVASTNDAYCPTLRGVTQSRLTPEIGGVLEIVVNGLTAEDVRKAMREGIRAACALGAEGGIRRISAGNYGGKLGQHRFPLRELLG